MGRQQRSGDRIGPWIGRIEPDMMVRLYDYEVPAADEDAGVPSLRDVLTPLGVDERRAILTGLFKPERIPGTMERLTTLVEDVDASFENLLVTLDNTGRPRRFVAIDEAKALLDRWLSDSAVVGQREWDVARLLEPYGDGTYHGKLLKRTRKQLRSVSGREALTVPFLFRRSWPPPTPAETRPVS